MTAAPDRPPAATGSRPEADDVRIEERGAAGIITLDRGHRRNALTDSMRRRMVEAYERWARNPTIYCVVLQSAAPGSFCSGGDVRELLQLNREAPGKARQATAEDYQHNWRLERYTKPHIALIDGVVMGGGVGISLYGTHRVAGPAYRFAMPETAIGLAPDVGAGWFFGHMPGEMGLYLGLTGRAIGRADAFRLGLATHCIDPGQFETIRTRLADADCVDPLLDGLHRDPGPGELEAIAEPVAEVFSAPSLVEALDRLGQLRGPHRHWAEATLATLAERSPTSLAVTFELIRRGARLDLREVLMLDFRLGVRMAASSEFQEGIRAHLVEKTRDPHWNPARLEDVRPEAVAALFAPLEDGDLELPLPQQPPRIVA